MLSKSEASIDQCRANILAVLAYHNFPLGAIRVLACQPDRIMVEPGMAAVNHLAGITGAAFRTCALVRNLHGPTAVWTMRECVPLASVQITGHYSPAPTTGYDIKLDGKLAGQVETTGEEILTWELDIDHGNPEYAACQEGHQDLVHVFMGVAATLVHGCEVAWPGKTDPFWIRKRLLSRGLNVPLVTDSQPT